MKPTTQSMSSANSLCVAPGPPGKFLGLRKAPWPALSDESTTSPDGSDPLASPVCSESENSPRSFCSAIQIGCFAPPPLALPQSCFLRQKDFSAASTATSSPALLAPPPAKEHSPHLAQSTFLKRHWGPCPLSPLLTAAELQEHLPLRSITPKASELPPAPALPRKSHHKRKSARRPKPPRSHQRKRDQKAPPEPPASTSVSPEPPSFPTMLSIEIPALSDEITMAPQDLVGQQQLHPGLPFFIRRSQQLTPTPELVALATSSLGLTCTSGTLCSQPCEQSSNEFEWRGAYAEACLKKGPFRRSMEDRFLAQQSLSSNLAVYAILDGHSGSEAADFLRFVLAEYLASHSGQLEERPLETVQEAVKAVNEEFLRLASSRPALLSGSTIMLAVLRGSSDLFLASLGDSGAMLVSEREGGKLLHTELFEAEHTCARQAARNMISEAERERIEKAGGVLFKRGADKWRLQGELALSRAFGNAKHQPFLSAELECRHYRLDATAQNFNWLILGSDGLWNSFRDSPALTRHLECEAKTHSLSAARLVDLALQSGVKDNMSAIAIDLRKWRHDAEARCSANAGSLLKKRRSSQAELDQEHALLLPPPPPLKRHAQTRLCQFRFE